MNRYEEELQNNLDAGKQPAGDALDVRAYQNVYSALKSEPVFSLPPSFAGRVSQIAFEKQKRKTNATEYIWLGLGILLLLITFIIAIALTEFRLDFGFLKGLGSYKGLIIFAIPFILLLHWLDKKYIKTTEAD
jgi:hypothetical protein